MSNYRPLPSPGAEFSWLHVDATPSSTASMRWENEGWTTELRLERDNAVAVIRLSAQWRVQQLLLFRDMEEPDLWLATDGKGHWGEMNGAHRTELDGCLDIDLVNTPFTNSIITHRMPLHVGHAAELPVITIDIETLAVERVNVRYERTEQHGWTYTSLLTGNEHTATVDEHGIVLDESGAFSRAV